MKKLFSIIAIALLATTGCSNAESPDNLGEVQGLTPIETTIVEGEAGNYADLYDAETYSIENPFIALDPYGQNKLSAYVAFPIEEAATYSYTVVGKDENTNYTQTSSVEQKDNLVIPVIGLYEDYNNTVEITVDYVNGAYEQFAINIQTDAVGEDVANVMTVDTSASDVDTFSSALEGGFVFTAFGKGYDANGDIRVSFENKGQGQAAPFHINEDGTFLNFVGGTLVEMDLTGRTITEYISSDDSRPHHDAIAASNGKVYSLMTHNYTYEEFQETGVYNEGIIMVWEQGQGEEPILEVDLSPLFEGNKVNNAPTNQDPGTDLLHFNSLSYYEPTNTLLVSSQSQNMILGLDADTLDVQWTTADDLVGEQQADKKLEWLEGHVHSNGQHNIQVATDPKYDDGNDKTIEMMLFSNYYCVDEDNVSVYAELSPDLSMEGCSDVTQSDVLVYRVDTENLTVETIDQFGFEGYFSNTMSGWTQSPDYEYNYITYANQGVMIVTDAEQNILGEVSFDEDSQIAPGYYPGNYRMPVITQDELQLMADKGLENTNY